MSNNPFKIGTISHNDFERMKDLNWHCAKCDLESGQAKTWQVWTQMGIQLDKDKTGNNYLRKYCTKCQKNTIHRKLKTLEILQETRIRAGISNKLSRRIKELLKNEEAVLLRTLPEKMLEIDHKFPQIRWGNDENENEKDMSDDQIRGKFILLTRSNNLLKSRYCEKCFKFGSRGSFPGIDYWYFGNETWQGNKNNEYGCRGCFWYDPYVWRSELNRQITYCKK